MFNLNFHPLEVVDRGSDTQLQVGENSSFNIKFSNFVNIISYKIYFIFRIWLN